MQHWSVTVMKDGEELVCIESNCLSGKGDLTPTDENVIRNSAQHLLSFVGARIAPDFLSQALNEGDGVYRP